ncbi:MAG: Eco57I restriction-modification methylase domain-containing protein [Bacteroidota bacterium]
MDKKTAQELIEKSLNNAFSEELFTVFTKNLLNDLEDKDNRYSGNLIWDDYKEHINTYKRIGKYIDPDGEALDVLIVEVKSVTKLERARTALRNFVIKHLSKFEKDYALVAFYSKEDDGADWRFSFIKLEYRSELDEEKGKVKTKKEFTPAKRYSFLVGKYEKAHTAKNQLLPLLQNISNNPTIDELESAFSIEKVTDEFFNQYKDLYIKLYEHFENDKKVKAAIKEAGIDNARFTKKLLGQIVFLYFLQKKGWLGVAQNAKWGTGKKRFVQELNEQAQKEKVNFFKDKLQYLFYEALAKERDNVNSYYKRFDCRIPFLNGGLFEADYNWQEANITIPQNLFRNEEKNKSGDVGTGILDVFDRYNFTIKEDEPLDKEVAVDPEMLGKVFENMLDITERKSKGAFYTPREIVHYMCQESLIHYLDNSLNSGTSSYQELGSDQTKLFGGSTNKNGNLKIELEHGNQILVPKKDIELFIREGHFALENDERVATKGETKTYQYQLPESIRKNADQIDQKLSSIKICDPAIGSGAFPVGLLHELVNAMLVLKPHLGYDYLTEKLKGFGFTHRESISDSRYIYRLKRHIIQESIYGVDIDSSAVDIARLRLWLSLVVDEDDLDPIETLPNLDYKIVAGNSLIGLPEDVFPNLKVLKEIEELKPSFYDETNESRKKELRLGINQKIRELLDTAEQFAGYKIDFDFKLYFSEVWHKKGGFDIVIGNPPYGLLNKKQNQNFSITVNSEHLDYFKSTQKYDSAKGGIINVFRLFITQSGDLLNNNGVFAEIFPLAYTGDVTSKNIREHNLKKFKLIGIEAFPERDNESKRVFKHAKMSVAILFFTSKGQETNQFYLRTHSDKFIDESNEKVILTKKDIIKLDPIYYTIPVLSKDDLKVLRKVYSNQKRIMDITNCYTGEIDLSLDKKYLRESEKYSILLKGAIIGRYEIRTKMSQGEIMFLDSDEYLKNNSGARSTHYLQDRIGMQGITGVNEKIRLKMALIPKGTFLANSVNYILMPEGLKQNKVALLQLNSELHNYIFRLTSTNSNVNGYEVNNLPIIPNPISPEILCAVVDYLILLTTFIRNENLNIQHTFFDSLASAITYELYFYDEVKSAGKEILKHLGSLKPITDDMTEEKKLAIIKSEFERLYDPNHPVRFAIETLDSVEEVRIIKQALK